MWPVACALLATPALFPAPAAAELPRYRFVPGTEWTLRQASESNYQNDQKMGSEGRTTITVLKANPDGSHRLLIRQTFRSYVTFKGDKQERPEEVQVGYVDIFSDGRYLPNDSVGNLARLNVPSLFPRLPATNEELTTTWTAKDGDDVYRYQLKPGGATNETVFEVTQENPLYVIYGVTRNVLATFDAKLGRITRQELDSAQTYGFSGKSTGTTAFESERQVPPDELTGLTADAEWYFAARGKLRQAYRSASKLGKEAGPKLDAALAEVRAVEPKLISDVFKDQLAKALKESDRIKASLLAELEERARYLNQPSAEWETTDLDGKAHALKDYRGKIVVLDFWYRGCGFCVMAMPQMKQLADQYRGKPVVIFGMNTDEKEEDAKFVVEKMGLNYANLKAKGLPEKYGVRGFPTLIIIDEEGVVRDFHVGYSPTLRDEVAAVIDGLLKKQ
jgi:thiol-disulfide isomerase/thioredoxin